MKVEQIAAQIRKESSYRNTQRKLARERKNGNTISSIMLEIKRQEEVAKARKSAQQMRKMRSNTDRLNDIKQRYISYARFAGNYIDRDDGDQRWVIDYRPGYALVGVDGWINYSRSYGTYVTMRGLVLIDRDTGEYRFLRVGPNVSSIDEALDYIMPAVVRKAKDRGQEVIRQGDVYYIPTRKWDLRAIDGTDHIAGQEGDSYVITHPHHPTITLNSPHSAYRQILVRNTRFGPGGGRAVGHGD